jgi:hypothetical protein
MVVIDFNTISIDFFKVAYVEDIQKIVIKKFLG